MAGGRPLGSQGGRPLPAPRPATRARRAERMLPFLPLAALAVALAGVLSRVPVLVHQCLPGDGLVGGVGLRLALLRPDGACPTGTLVADGTSVTSLLVVVAVPVVVAHLAAAGAGLVLLAGVGVGVQVLRRLVRGCLPAQARVSGRPAPTRELVAVVVRPLEALRDADVRRRGPPLLLGA